jgi:hypothetical protein
MSDDKNSLNDEAVFIYGMAKRTSRGRLLIIAGHPGPELFYSIQGKGF